MRFSFGGSPDGHGLQWDTGWRANAGKSGITRRTIRQRVSEWVLNNEGSECSRVDSWVGLS